MPMVEGLDLDDLPTQTILSFCVSMALKKDSYGNKKEFFLK